MELGNSGNQETGEGQLNAFAAKRAPILTPTLSCGLDLRIGRPDVHLGWDHPIV
jgi:hypothetical protein